MDLPLRRNWRGQEAELKPELGGIAIVLFSRIA